MKMEEMYAALCERKKAFFRKTARPSSSHNIVKHWGEAPGLQLLTCANSGDLKIEFLRIFIGSIMLVSSSHKNANLQRFRLREGTQSHIDDMRGRSIRNFLSFWTKLQALSESRIMMWPNLAYKNTDSMHVIYWDQNSMFRANSAS